MSTQPSKEEFLHRIQRGEPQAGDIVYVREGDVGRCAVVDGSHRFCLGQRVMMFRPNHSMITPHFLMFQLISPPILREQVLVRLTGTTSKHVNIKDLRVVQVVVPPLDKQQQIVTYLNDLQAHIDELEVLQEQTEEELNALLPSLLDKAFKGEL